MVDEPSFFHMLINGCLEVWISCLLQHDSWEEIIDERHEERLIFINQLGEIHVSETSHDDGGLSIVWVGSLGRSQRSKDRENVAETKVVVDLFGELVLAQLVEGVELLREDDVLKETTAGQLHSNDNLQQHENH